MKQIITVLLGCFLFYSCSKECDCTKENCEPNLTEGLLAYYPFNGNFNDESGNANHGSPQNGISLAADFLGRPSSAAGLDGINDYILVGNNGNLNSQEITVSMMVMVNNVNRRHAFLNLVNSDNATAFTYGLGQSLDATNRWDFGVGNPMDDCSTPLTYDDDTYARNPEVGQPGRWYHLIGVFSKGNQKLYVDGELRVEKIRNFTNLRDCASTELLLGGWWKNDIVSVDGKIDEVRIYNRELTACEISELTKTFKR